MDPSANNIVIHALPRRPTRSRAISSAPKPSKPLLSSSTETFLIPEAPDAFSDVEGDAPKPSLSGATTPKGDADNRMLNEFMAVQKRMRSASSSPMPEEVSTTGTNNYAKMVRVSGKFYLKWRVVEISAANLNAGDVFMVDTVDTIFVWMGKESARLKRTKVCDGANTIRHSERGGKCQVVQVLQGNEPDEFWAFLGGKPDTIPAAVPKQDELEDKSYLEELHLIGEKKDDWDVAEVINTTTGKMSKNILRPTRIYILDAQNEVYVWIGSKASPTLRRSAMDLAQDIFDSKPRAEFARILRVTQHCEPLLFKEKFASMGGQTKTVHNPNCSYSEAELAAPTTTKPTIIVPKVTIPIKTAQPAELKIDIRAVLGEPLDDIASEDKPEFVYGGTVRVFVVLDGKREQIDPGFVGQFFSENDYIIEYENPKEEQFLFYWQGKDTTIKSRGATSILTGKLSQRVGATSIRVPECQEPEEFLGVFKDSYVVHVGNYFDRKKTFQTPRLYHVTNTHKDPTFWYTIQRDLNPDLLNSSSCYILHEPTKLTVWRGKHAPDGCFATAQRVCSLLSSLDPTILAEDDGALLFPDHPVFPMDFASFRPHCFVLSLDKNVLKASEASLNLYRLNDVTLAFLPDSVHLFAVKIKKDNITPYAKLLHDNEERIAQHIYKTPTLPRTVFHHSVKSLPKALASAVHGFRIITIKGLEIDGGAEETIEYAQLWAILTRTYPYAELLKRPMYLDKTKLETYLDDAEFASIFKMDKTAFAAKRQFERDNLKKLHRLF